MTHPALDILEGRLMAQRALLARLVVLSADRDSLLTLLDDSSLMQDGQEDPGAVPAKEARVAGARAEECRLLAEAVRRRPPGS